MEKQTVRQGLGKRITFGRTAVSVAILIFAVLVSRAFYLVGDYYQALDAYSGDVARGDQLAAKADLENLQYFYELNTKLKPWGASWLADDYLFKSAPQQTAAYDYLTNRYERVSEELKDDNSFWGRYLRANSKWRLAQDIFERASLKDSATRLKEQAEADEMVLATKDDYEELIKMSQGEWLPAKWNYDLTTDPSARGAGLSPKPAKVKVMLGTGGKKDKGLGQDKGRGQRGRGARDVPIEGPPTDGTPKSGPKRPG